MNHNELLGNIDAAVMDAICASPITDHEVSPETLREQLDIISGGIAMLDEGGAERDTFEVFHCLLACVIRLTRKVNSDAYDTGSLIFENMQLREVVEAVTGTDADTAVAEVLYGEV